MVSKPETKHETAVRINARNAKGPIVRPDGMRCDTVYEFVLECFERRKTNPAIGWREIKEIHEESKVIKKRINGKEEDVTKTWFYYEMGPYQYQSYKELESIMHHLGRGLVQVGMRPGGEEKLHIFAGTSHKWMKMFLAAQSQGIPVVTAYDTLGEKGLIHSMIQTETTAIFTDNNLLPKLVNPLKASKFVKYLIHGDQVDPNDKRHNGKLYQVAHDALEQIREIRPDIQILHFNELWKLGKSTKKSIDPHPPKADDISCIMYTSGSTGDPKGVVLTHANVVAGVAGVGKTVINDVGIHDRVIAFLPLAHIFELAFELESFFWGGVLGYASVKTLSSTSVRNCQGDMAEFKPTIMVGVAAVWETVRKGILSQIEKLPAITQKIFWTAYNTKMKMNQYRIPGGDALGRTVFKKVKQATGGQLRYILNGGSPISTDAQSFLSNVLCPMLIGYGLTETVANGAVLQPDHYEVGVTGDLACSIEVKLVDVEELGYFAKDNQGEVWIRGAPVMKEYYKNAEETKAAISEDGWFMTGDIGEWTSKGKLNIIDRKKNLVKTLNGEYIALEKLESVYRSNAYVQNICVYADQTQVKPIGIIVPNLVPMAQLAVKLGIMKEGDSVENHIHHDKLKQAICADMIKTGKSQGLGGIELIAGVVMFDDEWTPENGMVTSAQKLKRKDILKAVQAEVAATYKNNT